MKSLSGSALQETPFTATYDEANRLTAITMNGEAFTLTYDANGNLETKSGATSGTTNYIWNARNQLASIAGPAGSASFKYDAFGRRIEKTVNGNTTGFLYDGVQVIAELKGSALDTVYHTGLEIDEVLARYGSSGNRTLLTDALMSVIAQANDDQSVANFYAYSPYGQSVTLGPDGGNSLQYTGRENDGTGLIYYRARYYDPVLKRFVSEDPIGLEGGVNLYAYVLGDPVFYSDPEGLRGGGGVRPGQNYQNFRQIQRDPYSSGYSRQEGGKPPPVDPLTPAQRAEVREQQAEAMAKFYEKIRQEALKELLQPPSMSPIPSPFPPPPGCTLICPTSSSSTSSCGPTNCYTYCGPVIGPR